MNNIVICLKVFRIAYREFYENSNLSNDMKDFFTQFSESLGLRYVNVLLINNDHYYEFLIEDERKWFLAKIKYGF